MPALAHSVENVPHSRIRELAEVAMSMDGVLRLYFGESNLPTPDYIKQAATKALADGYTFYTENAGLPSLRRAIARHYRKLHGVELDPEREIVITASGVQALNVSLRCMLDPGDEALVLTPAWPNGSSIIAMANAVARQIPHPLCGDRYRIDFDALEAAANAAHPAAALHVALESAGLGGDRRGAAAAARFLPRARTVAVGGRSLRPAVLLPAHNWASRCLRSSARPHATTRWPWCIRFRRATA